MITNDFKKHLLAKHKAACLDCPSNEAIAHLFEDIMSLLFPNFAEARLSSSEHIEQRLQGIEGRLMQLLQHHPSLCETSATEVAASLMSKLPLLEQSLDMDIQAIYEGDPAAKSTEEIVRSYPGFYAIAAYRVAHQLHRLGIKVIPRIITEHAHQRTGIDIHPAAQIDHSFCIDHGTGVVIGETSVIGHHVKIYQGVTLGALSVSKEDANSKRHPTIEPHVIVYANATVLGGDTVIGEYAVIGGNVWITDSVEPHSTVYYVSGSNQVKKKQT